MTVKHQFNDFKELLSTSEVPLLIVFYAPWCGPSHLMDTILEQMKTRLGSQLQIVKIDCEAHPSLASQYQVHPLPTLLLFKKGNLVARIEEEQTENLLPADRLIERLQALM